MLCKGTVLKHYYYVFLDLDDPFLISLRAVDFKHAAKSLYRRTLPFERHRYVEIRLVDEGKICFHGPISDLRNFF